MTLAQILKLLAIPRRLKRPPVVRRVATLSRIIRNLTKGTE